MYVVLLVIPVCTGRTLISAVPYEFEDVLDALMQGAPITLSECATSKDPNKCLDA